MSRRRQLIVGHPLNSSFVGIPDQAVMVSASNFAAPPGDKTIAIYAAKVGSSFRIAMAETAICNGVQLTSWRIETGFAPDSVLLKGRKIHRIVRSA